MKGDVYDPKALIRDAYLIDAITAPECRSIFLAWALDVPAGQPVADWASILLDRHSTAAADHPMTLTLQAALRDPETPRRRGGRAGRTG